MKIQELGLAEMARTGYTHKAIISKNGGDFTAAALSQVFILAALLPGWTIKDAAVRLVTRISGGAIATASLTVGDVAAPNGYVTATDVFTGAVVSNKAGDGANLANAGGKAYTGGETFKATLTTTVGNVSDAAAGEVHIFFTLFDANQL